MNWNADKIRDLRLRLGFSPSDLARRLQCESTEIRCWEIGIAIPEGFQLQQLDLLQKQAEACADEVAHHPLAETILKADDLGQIDLHQVKSRFRQNN